MARRRNIKSYFSVDYFSSEIILKNLVFVLFLGVLAIFYIANAHQAERNVRRIQELRRETKELRWYFRTLQSENMYKGRRSEMANSVKDLGLKPVTDKPKKIIVREE